MPSKKLVSKSPHAGKNFTHVLEVCWRTCSFLQPFWSQVRNLVFKLIDVQLGDDMAAYLLHLLLLLPKCYKRSLLNHLLKVGKSAFLCIGNTLPLLEWGSGYIKSIKSIKKEDFIASSKHKEQQFHKTLFVFRLIILFPPIMRLTLPPDGCSYTVGLSWNWIFLAELTKICRHVQSLTIVSWGFWWLVVF